MFHRDFSFLNLNHHLEIDDPLKYLQNNEKESIEVFFMFEELFLHDYEN